MLSPGGTPVSHCTFVPAASIEQSELRWRTRVTCPCSKRTKRKRSNRIPPAGSLSDLVYRLPGFSRAQSEQQSEYENKPGFTATAGIAYPTQTFASVERAMSPIADESEPFRACRVKVPFTIRGTPFAPSSETVVPGLCCAHRGTP